MRPTTWPAEAIRLESGSAPLLVSGSIEELHTAVGNLLGNAVKYSPEGLIATVRAYREGDSAMLAVEDYGIGIDAQHLKRIFKRFYRVPARAVQRRQGTGLGTFYRAIDRAVARRARDCRKPGGEQGIDLHSKAPAA